MIPDETQEVIRQKWEIIFEYETLIEQIQKMIETTTQELRKLEGR